MIYKKFEEIKQRIGAQAKKLVAIAAAHDVEVIKTAVEAKKQGIADFVLIGDGNKIEELSAKNNINLNFKIINEPCEKEAALKASELVRNGGADILMKGFVNSSVFLRAVLDKERGLKGRRKLSHLAVFEIPTYDRLAFHTDGGMNPFPDYEEKRQIISNAIEALERIGIKKPNVAILAANETVSDKMPSTVDAVNLVAAAGKGEFPDCTMEGPVAMDVALSEEAAKHKGIKSEISGAVDLFVVPNIEAGNMVGKTLIYCAKAKMAGMILGCSKPVVMTSRSENVEGKINSIMLATSIS